MTLEHDLVTDDLFGLVGTLPRPGWVVLDIDVDRLESEVRYEKGEPDEMFPHVYGPVNVDAVVGIKETEQELFDGGLA